MNELAKDLKLQKNDQEYKDTLNKNNRPSSAAVELHKPVEELSHISRQDKFKTNFDHSIFDTSRKLKKSKIIEEY